jgi:hypothetical protein
VNEVLLRGERFILGRNLKLCEIEDGVEVENVPYFFVFFGNFDVCFGMDVVVRL